jgi:serine/threonine protein phosphatase PrpC
MTCPGCGAPVGAGDAFCESCGAQLSDRATSGSAALPNVAQSGEDAEQSARTHLITLHAEPDEPPAAVCGECGGQVGEDGWCTVCGARASNGREHVAEQVSDTVVGASDRGKLHPRNEDAFALATADSAGPGGWAALVVCDGVTTASDSDVASLAAALAARDLLAAAERVTGSAQTRQRHWAQQLRDAALAADKAAEAGASESDENPPSCTFVAAVVDGDVIVAAWVGDSRAYWLPDDGPAEQLTVDDSWATEQVRVGVPREVAEADPKAHAITKWLGIDSPEVDASTSATVASGPGWLLVCSDGLWNYCSDADDLRLLVGRQPPEPPARAEALIDWANEQGGHDNITVTLARIGAAR